MNPTMQKRQKERERHERQRTKAEKRKQRRDAPTTSQPVNGEDPDIAGIVPGPQPIPEEDV